MRKTKKSIIAFNCGEFATIKSFKPIAFEGFKKQAGLNSFIFTAKQWIEKTGVIVLVSNPGGYGQYDRQ